MIRIGINKEFTLGVSMMMIQQLEEFFGGGIHSHFTDSTVLFSIEVPRFIKAIYRRTHDDEYQFLRYYKFVLVTGDHEVVSREFSVGEFFQPQYGEKCLVFPYIHDRSWNTPLDYIPHVLYSKGKIIRGCLGQSKTPEDMLFRLKEMGLPTEALPENPWDPEDEGDEKINWT